MLLTNIVSLIFNQKVKPTQRLVWIILNLDNYVLKLANIYASDNATERVNFQWWMGKELPDANWLVCGDLYMVELAEDKEELLPTH